MKFKTRKIFFYKVITIMRYIHYYTAINAKY